MRKYLPAQAGCQFDKADNIQINPEEEKQDKADPNSEGWEFEVSKILLKLTKDLLQ